MTRFILSTIIACGALFTQAQDQSKYEKAMESIIATIPDTSRDAAAMKAAALKFERIAMAEGDKWLPYYWAAYAYQGAMQGEADNESRLAMIKSSERNIEKAHELAGENSEIYIVKSSIETSYIMIDWTTAQVRSANAEKHMEKAHELDSLNPRYEYLKGTSLFFRPTAFGGDPDKGAEVLQVCVDKGKVFKPESSIHPTWGPNSAQQILDNREAIQKQKEEQEKKMMEEWNEETKEQAEPAPSQKAKESGATKRSGRRKKNDAEQELDK